MFKLEKRSERFSSLLAVRAIWNVSNRNCSSLPVGMTICVVGYGRVGGVLFSCRRRWMMTLVLVSLFKVHSAGLILIPAVPTALLRARARGQGGHRRFDDKAMSEVSTTRLGEATSISLMMITVAARSATSAWPYLSDTAPLAIRAQKQRCSIFVLVLPRTSDFPAIDRRYVSSLAYP